MFDRDAAAALAGTRFGGLRWHPSIDSTQREAGQLARAGAPEGVVVVADHQTAGRGRRGRAWLSAPGSSLLLSVVLRPPLPPQRAGLVTVLAGLAGAGACAEVGGFTPGLKWPNDLVVADPGGGERKLGGILAEAQVHDGALAAVVVGVGLNVVAPAPRLPDSPIQAVAAEEVAGRAVDRYHLLVALLRALDERYGEALEQGWLRALDDYRSRCLTLGRGVTVQTEAGRLTGRAVDVGEDGSLLVEVGPGDVRAVVAGDVVHVRPA